MTSAPSEVRIAIVGGAGFVGRQLLRDLEKAGRPALVVVRGAPELSIDGTFHAGRRAGDLKKNDRFDIVVNLAYPVGGSPLFYPAQNRAIFDTVEGLVNDGGHLIQVSTQAVFGLMLQRPVQVGPVAAVRDDAYVESKIEAEKHLENLQKTRGWTLDVVRLGNIWGRGSGAWTAPLVRRLLTGRPVAVKGVDAPSNTTDVANAAAYLVHLLGADRSPGVRYHHVAEFSAVPWSRWVEGLAAELQVEPVAVEPEEIELPSNLRDEISKLLAGASPRALYRQLASERVAGSWARSAMRRLLPASIYRNVKASDVFIARATPLSGVERTYLAVMAARQEFKPSVRPGWNAPVDLAESLRRVIEWLRAG